GSGTTGDGYALAARFGHTVVPPRPALVPVTVAAAWVPGLRGVTVPDAGVRVVEGGKALAARRGSLLFAHVGLSGPAVLDVSRAVSGHAQPRSLALELDFAPGVKEPELDERLRVEAAAEGKKQLAAVLAAWLPRRLVEALLGVAGMPADRRAAALGRLGRGRPAGAPQGPRPPRAGAVGLRGAGGAAGGGGPG